MVVFALYVVLLAAGLWGAFQLRNWALATYDTSDAQSSWSEWQEESKRQSTGEGPVARRPAKSDEPPALILARDYYVTITVILVLLGTVLFAAVALMLRGTFSSPGRVWDDSGRAAEP